jgi:hypothetical protein
MALATAAGSASGRKVRTTEGARFFGVPIGTEIGNRFDPNTQASTRAMTMTRLVSLQRQFEIAKETGNINEMRNVQEVFTTAVKEYAANTGQLTDVIDDLVASRGRADKALGQKTPGQADAPTPAAPAEAPAAPEAAAAPTA